MPARKRRSGRAKDTPAGPSADVSLVRDDLDARRLGQRILDDLRWRPLVVVTIDAGQAEPYLDLTTLADKVGDRAEIAVVYPTATWAMNDAIGDVYFGAHSGAGRVYPSDPAWRKAAHLAPLRLADTPDGRARLMSSLLADLDRTLAVPRSTAAAPGLPGDRVADATRGVHTLDGRADGAALARHVLDPCRIAPVVVVTVPVGKTESLVDADAIADAVRGLAEVWLLKTGTDSRAFASLLPQMCEVYGGAVRVYPGGVPDAQGHPTLTWLDDPYSIPLRFVFGAGDAQRALEDVPGDVFRAVNASKATAPEPTGSIAASGQVEGVTAGRALVRLDGGGHATIWTELLSQGVPDDALFLRGMAVRGQLDLETKRLDVSEMVATADAALAGYDVGEVVLGYTSHVERELCIVRLLPDFPVVLTQPDLLDAARPIDLRTVIGEGETVLVKVTSRGPECEDWTLSLLDVRADDSPLPAPSVLAGGPPWLAPPLDFAEELLRLESLGEDDRTPTDEPATAPEWQPVAPDGVHQSEAAARPAKQDAAAPDDTVAPENLEATVGLEARDGSATEPATHGWPTEQTVQASASDAAALREELAVAQLERDALRQERAHLAECLRRQEVAAQKARAEVAVYRKQVRESGKQVRELKNDLERAREELGRPVEDTDLFLDPVEQLRFEIELAWARRIPGSDKASRKLCRYTVGPEFLHTLATVSGISRAKVVDVVVEVLTGIAEEQNSRELHRLRTGNGGADPLVTRPDKAACWRVSLQTKTPSARRLHFWRLPDGSVELSSVRLHDDVSP